MNGIGTELLTAMQIGKAIGKHPRTVKRVAKRDGWAFVEEKFKGGRILKYPRNDPGVQKALGGSNGNALPEGQAPPQISTAMTLVGQSSLFDPISSSQNGDAKPLAEKNASPSVSRSLGIREAENAHTAEKIKTLHATAQMPPGWKYGRRAWLKAVGKDHERSLSTIYRWMQKSETDSTGGLRHGNTVPGKDISWNPERSKNWDTPALNLLRGSIVNRPHRRFTIKAIWKKVKKVADEKGWKCGSYRGAVWWAKRIDPILKIYSRGGEQALDDVLPPIRRKSSDVDPFEILCGDQHRFNFWLMDALTGELFRPEAYFWSCIRTKLIYGFALAKDYDAWLMGMALRMGVSDFGLFKSLYNDNGQPEKSKYIKGILEEIAKFGILWAKTDDLRKEFVEDDEESTPQDIPAGTQKRAKSRNPKGKGSKERFFGVFEDILENEFCVPGRAKCIKDNMNYQREDQREIQALAEARKLLTPEEFFLKLKQARDYYNKEKLHRALYGEVKEGKKPLNITPFQSLQLCKERGLAPNLIREDQANILFLPKAKRKVRLGQIEFQGNFYEADALIRIHDWVELRYNPMNLGAILVFHGAYPLCLAQPIQWSSYKNKDLTKKKNLKKAAIKKYYKEEYKRITSGVPEFLQYSAVPESDRAAPLTGPEKKKRALELGEAFRVRNERGAGRGDKKSGDKISTSTEGPKTAPGAPSIL